MNILFAIVTGILFGVGIFQILRRDLIKTAMGYYILFTAINLFFIAAGLFDGEQPPYDSQAEQGQVSDPLVQALILTAIVISFGTYAILLVLINISAKRFKTVDLDEVNQLRK
jgi:multicomponent Na+:H+ antiporter subunit C